MRVFSSILATAGLLSTTSAAIKGFNYGAQFNNDQAKTLVDFEYEFNAAKQLPGTNGWTSARLYTMIQHGTSNSVIEAIQAAVNTNTTLLLGLWASAGQAVINNEIAALKAALQQHGTAFSDLVVGISVGSEDLYRITPTGILNKAGAGAQPGELVNYIQQTRDAVKGTALEGKPIGHVDTWTVYVNSSNHALISALDFVGMDAYPYFQSTMANSIGSGSQLFFDAYHATVGAAQGKPVWVTETGWPVSGQTLNQAVASKDNARIYWEDVSCQLVKDNVNLYYYTLQDVQYGNPSPSFGIKPAGDLLAVAPLFDLSCPASAKPTSPAVSRSASTGIGLSTTSSTQLSVFSTFTRTITTMAATSPGRETPSAGPSPPSTSYLGLPDLPIPRVPRGLPSPFEAPNLIVPFEKADPKKVIGDSYTAQLSPSVSTVFVFDVSSTYQGKTCTLALRIPPAFDLPAFTPLHINAPGGISVSRVDGQTPAVGQTGPVGSVASVGYDGQYNIASGPCEAGQKVGYQVDSVGGLTMDFFQMVNPPLGFFLLVT